MLNENKSAKAHWSWNMFSQTCSYASLEIRINRLFSKISGLINNTFFPACKNTFLILLVYPTWLKINWITFHYLIGNLILVEGGREGKGDLKVKVHVPTYVREGDRAVLKCLFNVDVESLYTVKWYKGPHEFFRYTPKENPVIKTFPEFGLNVDVSNDTTWTFFCIVIVLWYWCCVNVRRCSRQKKTVINFCCFI